MNISKLGIVPGPWRVEEKDVMVGEYTLVDSVTGSDQEQRHNQMIATAPEMLEALIEDVQVYEFEHGTTYNSTIEKNTKAIEKATGKPWAEIKALVEGE